MKKTIVQQPVYKHNSQNIQKYKYNPNTYKIYRDKIGCDKMKIDIHTDTDEGDVLMAPTIVNHKGQISGLLKYAGRTIIPIVVGEKGVKYESR